MTLDENDPRWMPIALRKELLADGYSERALAGALRNGTFERPRYGAYVDGEAWRALTDEHRYAVKCRAAYGQSRTGVVLSHASAAAFHDAPLWGLDLSEVHLTRTDERAGRREAGVCQHRGRLLPEDTMMINGLQLMSPTRAVIEVSTQTRVEAALVVADDLLHRGLTTVEDVTARYERSMEHWPNSLATQIVLRLMDPRIESVGEARTDFFLWKHRFPRPVPQYFVEDPSGVTKGWRLDFAFPELGFWIEFDGKTKYARYLRPGETAADAVLREKRREDRIRAVTGWWCLRICWADLENPNRLAAEIRAFIARVRSRIQPTGS